jgi:hypothetical protein
VDLLQSFVTCCALVSGVRAGGYVGATAAPGNLIVWSVTYVPSEARIAAGAES